MQSTASTAGRGWNEGGDVSMVDEIGLRDIESQIKCQIDSGDDVPLVQIALKGLNSSGTLNQFFVVCEKKHITKFIVNPSTIVAEKGSNVIDPEGGIDIHELKKDYSKFFEYTPQNVSLYFDQFLNFYTLEYWDNAALALRILYEKIVYDNFGGWVFYPDLKKLNICSDEILAINENIKTLGFGPFIQFLVSSGFKDDIQKAVNSGETQVIHRKKVYDEKRFKILSEANKNYPASDSKIKKLIGNLQTLQSNYEKLSPAVHGRTLITSPELENICKDALIMYQLFFEDNNSWGVEYD